MGAVLGLLAAAGGGQAMSSFLFGVEPLDLATFMAVAGVLVMTAAIAMTVPAIRATRVDPVEAFRSE